MYVKEGVCVCVCVFSGGEIRGVCLTFQDKERDSVIDR